MCYVKMLFCRFICLVLPIVLQTGLARRVRRGFCSTRGLQIPNGDYSVKSGNSVVDYTCNENFILYGLSRLVCFGSKWSADPPICISNTCPEPPFVEGLRIEKKYNGSILQLSCDVMFRLEGSKRLICNGTNWSASLPTCIPWVPPMSCDFESPSICSWSHHHDNDVDWRWNSGSTRTSRTGPTHDHTLGEGGEGHYMYFESSSPARTDNVARLQSPLYPPEFSEHYCFQFWYHFLSDEDDDGWYHVIILQDEQDWSEVTPAFSVNISQGDVWKMHEIRLGDLTKPFTINFVGKKGIGYRSDFAFDDVKLYRCVETSPVSPRTTPTRTPTSTTRQTSPPTTLPVTSPSTSTTPPSTTTTVSTPSPVSSTETNTSPKPTSTQTTPSVVSSSTKPINRTIITTRPVTDVTTNRKGIKTTTASVTTENPSESKNARELSTDDDGLSSAAYVGICVGLLILVVAAATFGYVWYRRRRKMEDYGFSANNPCYIAANGDDPKVCFADDDSPYNTIDD